MLNYFGVLASLALYLVMVLLGNTSYKFILFNTGSATVNALAIVFLFLIQYMLVKGLIYARLKRAYFRFIPLTIIFLNVASSFLIQFFERVREIQGISYDFSGVVIYPLMVLIAIGWGCYFDKLHREIVQYAG